MAQTVGEYLLRRLLEWNVRRVYGYPGDGINGIMGAFHAVKEMSFVQVRHEEMAAFMACAHAKFTGEVGVCLATSGPGAIHLLNGLYDAQLDHQPVVAIVGQTDRSAMGGEYQQEVDLLSLFKDVAHEFVQTAMTPVQIRQLIDRAVRIAVAERTVTCVIIPRDLQEMDAVAAPAHQHGTVHTGVGYHAPRVLPHEEGLRHAAEVLNSGARVAMLVGQGALGAAEEVAQAADLLGAGVAKALLGKAALPDDLPWVTGAIGLLGTKPSWELMAECDTLFMIGSSFPYAEFLPEEGQARGVQIDIAPRRLSLRYPMEVSLVGDAAETLRALIPRLKRKADRGWRKRIESSVADWWKVLEARAMNDADPVNPQRVFWELSPRLPDDAILSSDSGSAANWFARDIKIRRGMMCSLSGTLATMGPGVPYAVAAKFAFPERVAVALVGDGAMQMNGNNELITIAKYWREWKDPRLVVLVLNNRDLNQVTWEQRAMSGDPKLRASQELPDFPYAKYAESLGLRGIRIDRPEQIGPAWDQAFRSDRPVVVEAVTDPEVPPLPPHITFKQAKALASSLLKGDPSWRGIVRQTYRDMIESWIPHRG
jgi:pyruvate dehydrogenase (quinone)